VLPHATEKPPAGDPHPRSGWAWVSLGFGGSVLIALAGGRPAGDGATRWWFAPRLGAANQLALYTGMLVLAGAWLALGHASLPTRRLWLIAFIWCTPLAAGPVLFSHDVYSYLAQGEIVHLGRNPYRVTPLALAHLGQARLLSTVYPFWRGTTAPYGPLFLSAVSVIMAISGSSLTVAVLLVRLLELAGIVLLAAFVPRLAVAQGADPARATWLAVLNPIVLLELVAAAHNDALMAGLMVAGLALAMQRHPLAGITLCAVAATIKVPAGLAAVFIAVAWARGRPARGDRLRALAQAAAVTVAVIATVSAITGLGLDWLSASVFATPSRVRLAITPATALGWTVASLLHDLGVPIGAKGFELIVSQITFATGAMLVLVVLGRVRSANITRLLGLALLILAAAGPAAWPWYFVWGLVLVAACAQTQFSPALAVAITVAVFVVKANGIVVLPLPTAPFVLAGYALIAAAGWYSWRPRAADYPTAGPTASTPARHGRSVTPTNVSALMPASEAPFAQASTDQARPLT